MKHFAKLCVASTLIALSTAATAFSFSLPGLPSLGGGGDHGGGVDIGSVASNASKAFKETTEEEEIAIGQEYASILLGAKPLLANPGLQRYVNTLGRWLASQTERPDLPWTFAVLDDAGYNAFATPGGYIFVTKGLIERMHSEAELAGVLAHEIGHVVKKHHLNAIKKQGGIGLLMDIAKAKTGGNMLGNGAVNFIHKAIVGGLDKGDEFEADRLGVVIAARAGYDAYGLPAVLQMLQGQSDQDANFSLLFATHPSPSARIDSLDKSMQAQFDNLPHAEGKPLKERLKEFAR